MPQGHGRSGGSPLLMCYYGDDFTGSTDSMEALTSGGVKTVLFLRVPEPSLLQDRFRELGAFGVAGVGRTMSPEEMERQLLPLFRSLRAFGAPIVHYKICSTFDSSPRTGSIGKVLELARRAFPEQRVVPVVAGVPALGRYTVFGQHFAAAGGQTHRLDRHPTMSRHPVTPMDEADLRLHLARQTVLRIGSFDVLDLERSGDELRERYAERTGGGEEAILFDLLQEEHLPKIGGLLWEEAQRGPAFVVGSSGVPYALTAHWRRSGLVRPPGLPPSPGPADRLLVVSGSCSPVTQGQIEWALEHGFAGIRLNAAEWMRSDRREELRRSVFEEALGRLREGRSVVVYSALGPDDPAVRETKARLSASGLADVETGKILGAQMGRLVRELVPAAGLRRAVICGGDTSGYAARELGVYGLELLTPVAPGAPLCRCHAEQPEFDGLQLALKGGQTGQIDYFGRIRAG